MIKTDLFVCDLENNKTILHIRVCNNEGVNNKTYPTFVARIQIAYFYTNIWNI